MNLQGMTEKEYVGNLLLNMNGGLLPKNLTLDEIDLLRKYFGKDWFYHLGYTDEKYTNPEKEQEKENVRN